MGEIMFMGEYHHSIDEKGRIVLPSKIREELGEQFIITRGLDNCLSIYRMDDFKTILNEYKELPNTKDARNYMRFFLSAATNISFDKQGRINIPTTLVSFASLKKECVIIGVNDRLEIWSKENWEQFMNQNQEFYTDIADKLFSGKDLYA